MLARWTGDPEPQIAGEVPELEIDATELRDAIEHHPDVEAAESRTGQAGADVAEHPHAAQSPKPLTIR